MIGFGLVATYVVCNDLKKYIISIRFAVFFIFFVVGVWICGWVRL